MKRVKTCQSIKKNSQQRRLQFESLEHRRVMDTGIGPAVDGPTPDAQHAVEIIKRYDDEIKLDIATLRQKKYGTINNGKSFHINRVPADLQPNLTEAKKGTAWMPQGDRPSQSARVLNNRIPLGVFTDGSVKPLHPNIDQRVFDLMKQHGTGPVMPTLHRPGVFGAPTNTVAGSNPIVQELSSRPENWDYGVGNLCFHEQSVEIRLPSTSTITVDQIYHWLTKFSYFDKGNAAKVTIHSTGPLDSPAFDGQLFAIFKPATVYESLNTGISNTIGNFLQPILNGNSVAVRIYLNPEIHEVMAVTLGNHMLCGARIWRTYSLPNGDIRVQTIAWEQRNGRLNNMGFAVLGQTAMTYVWKTYMENIAKSAIWRGGSYYIPPAHTSASPGNRTNPFYTRAANYRQAHQLSNQLTSPVIQQNHR